MHTHTWSASAYLMATPSVTDAGYCYQAFYYVHILNRPVEIISWLVSELVSFLRKGGLEGVKCGLLKKFK
jgi:hypothetical protein